MESVDDGKKQTSGQNYTIVASPVLTITMHLPSNDEIGGRGNHRPTVRLHGGDAHIHRRHFRLGETVTTAARHPSTHQVSQLNI
ncbi:hypothetical protein GPALN_004517 [Globodera pallida]|nr:hypothetical protein GPALN_004517 [Globodera pallida]